jgi:hypothetical protein
VRKSFLTGAIALMGLAAPMSAVATVSSAASTVAPAASPILYHVPIQGKQILSLHFHGLRNTTATTSSNWGGYAETGQSNGSADTFETAYASWIEPTATCTKTTSSGLLGLLSSSKAAYASFWVGLDGYASSSVEQTGTDSDCSSGGTPTYYAWYEMYPAGSVDLSTTQYPVKPGDHMTAMIMSNATGTSFSLMLKNATAGWTNTFNASSSGLARSSAEFVAEAPSQCALLFCSELPLANFGSVSFTSAGAADVHGTNGPITDFANAAMTMDDNGNILATPSTLAGGGTSFNVTWNNS